MPQTAQRLPDRGRMMPEIVDHFYAARFAAHFLPPRDALKTLERLADLLERNAVETRRGNRHGGVAHVELAHERQLEFIVAQRKSGTIRRVGHVRNFPRAIWRHPHFLDLRHQGLHLPRDVDAIRVVAVQQDHPVLRHDVEQPPEAKLDLIEVVEDIRVIELDVVHDQQFRQVMDELRALIEKGGVVFVAFDHEIF